jgi:hypothetical protein
LNFLNSHEYSHSVCIKTLVDFRHSCLSEICPFYVRLQFSWISSLETPHGILWMSAISDKISPLSFLTLLTGYFKFHSKNSLKFSFVMSHLTSEKCVSFS